jgi:hypothetical protein
LVRREDRGRRRRKEEGGRRKEEGGKRKEEGGRRKEERKEEGGKFVNAVFLGGTNVRSPFCRPSTWLCPKFSQTQEFENAIYSIDSL